MTFGPFMPTDQTSIVAAVQLWCSDRDRCLLDFGHISTWDTTYVTNMDYLFQGYKDFNEDISDWDVRNVTSMNHMFEGAATFNQPLNDWDVSNVSIMDGMFMDCASFNKPLDQWNVSRVTAMREMFCNASQFNQCLDSWNVENVIDMSHMFENAHSMVSLPKTWKVSSVTRQFDLCKGTSFENQFIEEKVVASGNSKTLGINSFEHAVTFWVDNMEQCALMYGHISTWKIDDVCMRLLQNPNYFYHLRVYGVDDEEEENRADGYTL
jgi:surface protein